ncbi:MAG: response regulator [Deltaproteobacteria bacterium]|nr:response regulator [Deltaproteobacteria bacterium]
MSDPRRNTLTRMGANGWDRLVGLTMPDGAKSAEDLLFWRERVLWSVVLGCSLVGFLAYAPGARLALIEGRWWVLTVDTFAYAVVISLLFLRRLSYRLRAVGLCAVVYVLSWALILSVGPYGAGTIWLFAFAVLTGALLSRKAAVAALILNALTLLVVGLLLSKGAFEWPAGVENAVEKWLVVSASFIFLNTMATMMLNILINGIETSLAKERIAGRRLEARQHELRSANQRMHLEMRERIAKEKALRESEEKHRLTLESVPDATAVCRMNDFGFIYINGAFARRFGYSSEKMKEIRFTDLIRNADADGIMELLRRDGKVTDVPVQFATSEGEVRDGLFSATLIAVEGEIRFVGVIKDITEWKRAEREKCGLEEQLKQSQKMEAIGTLAGGIAHDFNNILAAMMGYTELTLGDLPEGSREAENLRQVLWAGRRAKGLVRQILSFSRQNEQEQVPVDLASIVKEALNLLRASIPSTIEIRQSLGETDARILADPVQMHQLLMNLCTNAAQAMEEGGVLEVGLSNERFGPESSKPVPSLKPGNYLKLTVSDTGIGMDQETLARIFDPFFTTKEVDKGTGMGLAVAHGVVKSHGGEITAGSEPGHGSTFTVYLPVFEGTASSHPISGDESLPTGTERVLLVDDEEVLVDLEGQTLEGLGYRATTFTSSTAALEYFKAHANDFDLVITDYTMPKMTGLSLSQELLRIRPELPIIITTGFSRNLTEEKARSVGIKRVLMKPLGRSMLAKAVRHVLEHQKSA